MWTHPLEFVLEDTGHVKAEVGAKREHAVEEQQQKPVGTCKQVHRNCNPQAVKPLARLYIQFAVYYQVVS